MKLLLAMHIGRRLALGFAVVLAFAVLITGIGIWQLNALADAMREMMREPFAKERYISDWKRHINVAVIRTTAVAKSSDPSLVPFFAANAAEITNSTSALLKQIEPLITSTLLEKTYLPAANIYMKLVGELLGMQRQNLDARVAEISAIERTSHNSLVALGALVLALGAVFKLGAA